MAIDAHDASGELPRDTKGAASWGRLRREADLTLTQLAQRSGLPRSVVGLIDQGRLIPSPSEAAAILRAVGALEPEP